MLRERALGRQGLTATEIGFGTMGMTAYYGTEGSREEHVAVIRRAFELGVTMFDTAEIYNQVNGSNECLLGEAVAPFRDQVRLATKFGFAFDEQGNAVGKDSTPANIRRATENSLRYLGTDVIDVLYQHRQDPNVPVEEVAGTVKDLIEEGKVRWFGLSEVGPETLRRAHAVQPVSVLQTEYSLFERAVEAEVLPTARDLGIGFVPYSPLGRGFLTSAVKPAEEYDEDDFRRHDARWQGENYRANKLAVDQLHELAKEKATSAAQLALAWLLAQGKDVVPIPGTRSVVRLEENLGAADVELKQDDLARIQDIVPIGAAGSRYAPGYLPTWT